MQKKTTIEVHLQPGAKNNEIAGLKNSILHARVTAPPREGKANQALLVLIAQALGVSKSDLAIIRGYTNRHKVVAIQGLNWEELTERLARVLP